MIFPTEDSAYTYDSPQGKIKEAKELTVPLLLMRDFNAHIPIGFVITQTLLVKD